MINPYGPQRAKTLSDGTLDFTAYQTAQPGVVESGANTQEYFDGRRSGELQAGQAAPAPSAGAKAGVAAAQSAISGGGAEDVAATGLIATGNPYAIAAGLGLSAFSANQKAQQAQKQAEYMAKLQHQQKMIESAREGASAYDRMRNLV